VTIDNNEDTMFETLYVANNHLSSMNHTVCKFENKNLTQSMMITSVDMFCQLFLNKHAHQYASVYLFCGEEKKGMDSSLFLGLAAHEVFQSGKCHTSSQYSMHVGLFESD
jgi:hypothetical protein